MKAYVVESTAAGTAAVAVLEVVGPDAEAAVKRAFPAARLQSGTPRRLTLSDRDDLIDEVILLNRCAAETMTGWPHVEVQCHGSRAVVRRIRKALVAVGVVPAPQSFLLRSAVRNGKMTRLEEEAWLCAMHALTERAANELFEQRTKLPLLAHKIGGRRDRHLLAKLYSTGMRGCCLAHPPRIVVCGAPNAGKSSLVNALSGRERVLTHFQPGTTRDVVDVPVSLSGFGIMLVDTAGIRETTDPVERAGVNAALRAARHADHVIWLVDPDCPLLPPDDLPATILWTKCDVYPSSHFPHGATCISSMTGEGLPLLNEILLGYFELDDLSCNVDGALLFTLRQYKRVRELLAAPDSEWQVRWERWVYGRPRGQ